MRAAPKGKLKLSPFEMTYKRPFPKGSDLFTSKPEVSVAIKHILNPQQVMGVLNQCGKSGLPLPSEIKLYPGDWVYLQLRQVGHLRITYALYGQGPT